MSETVNKNICDISYQDIYIGPKAVSIPEDWDKADLEEIAQEGEETFIDGDWVESDDMVADGEYQLIQLGNIGEGHFKGECDKFVSEDFFKQKNCTLVEEGDLLISRLADPVLRTIIVPQFEKKSITAVDIVVAKVDEREWDKRYIWQLLNSKHLSDAGEALATGSTRQRISRSTMAKINIPCPPLPEQRRIADILSTVDEQIQQTDEMIEETKELKSGLMQDLLTRGIGHDTFEEQYLGPQKIEVPEDWTKSRLKDVSKIITRGKQPTYVEEGGVPVLNQSCIYWDGFHPEGLKRLDEEVAAGWKDKYWVKKGDVLINSTGKGTLGRALEWTNESDTHALDSHITRVHPDESVLDPTYFRFYLESNHGQKMLYAFCVAGSTGQIELSKTDLQTMPVLLPPVEEQRAISEAFHRVNMKLQDEQETKAELQELKRGLMQDLLTGKVRVDPD
ncbi:Type I restriction-modification system, S subunit [Halorhabdus sp. SVX81]|uniref:restriction endonuclease subunit S n=1 Tax=Halorhabdus sp. SVX81 TaxID=2978283 RepID=UPI0023DC369A|nr:restriction endonuclease subunit S [Halorhabdus sp. SVX81]WEL17370.1 Type I restriction-modification system, S subunit [Halorhabdus sp. SVX81]